MSGAVWRLHHAHADRSLSGALVDALPSRVRSRYHAAGFDEPAVVRVLTLAAVATLVVLFVAWFLGVVHALVVGVIALGAMVIKVRRASRLARATTRASLPQLCEAVSRSIRSGASVHSALIEACRDTPASVASELQDVLAQADRGITIGFALRAWADRAANPEARVVAAALTLAAENEAASTQALDGAAQTLRDRSAIAAEVRSLTAQAMASMTVLVGLPVAFLLLDAVTGMRALGYLVSDPVGRLCFGAGLGLDVLGWVWMRAMIDRRMG